MYILDLSWSLPCLGKGPSLEPSLLLSWFWNSKKLGSGVTQELELRHSEMEVRHYKQLNCCTKCLLPMFNISSNCWNCLISLKHSFSTTDTQSISESILNRQQNWFSKQAFRIKMFLRKSYLIILSLHLIGNEKYI